MCVEVEIEYPFLDMLEYLKHSTDDQRSGAIEKWNRMGFKYILIFIAPVRCSNRARLRTPTPKF